MVKTNLNIAFYLFIGCCCILACKTTEPPVTQAYHNVTAHYNAYFNANEKLNVVLKSLRKAETDNFDDILSPYEYGSANDAKTYSADLEAVVKKATSVISDHKISRWTDDAYLLIGKARYISGDYKKATETFVYITSKYPEGVNPDKKKKKKKKGSKKDDEEADPTGLLVHELARNEALVWLVKSYTAQKKFDEALNVASFANNDDRFPKGLEKELLLAEVNLRIKKEDYTTAIANLSTLVDEEKNGRRKARYNFIQGQLNEKLNNNEAALQNYQACLEGQTPYDMAFYATLKNAQLSRSLGSTDTEIKNLLNKMLKDSKNEVYYDQIYFELGEIAVAENDLQSAKEYFKKSLRANIDNQNQKVEAYLRLAELFFEEETYHKSLAYYDSALATADEKYIDYTTIEDRVRILSDLVTQLERIASEDSLQYLSTLSKDELDEILKDKIAAIEKAKSQERSPIKPKGQSGGLGTLSPGKWYFYNETARMNGQQNFVRIWGDRPVEDNWRTEDQQIGFEEEQEDSGKSEEPISEANENIRNELLKGIPFTDENKEASKERIVAAYYNIAYIYKDDLDNMDKALLTFELLQKRYPGSRLEAEILYNLYLLHKEKGNDRKSNGCKETLLKKYPYSNFAKIIDDPNFLTEAAQETDKARIYYDKAYEDYEKGKYAKVVKNLKKGDELFSENQLKPQFDLLLAMAQAQEGDLADYRNTLTYVLANHKQKEITARAEQMLALLQASNYEIKNNSQAKLEEERRERERIAKEKARQAFVKDSIATTKAAAAAEKAREQAIADSIRIANDPKERARLDSIKAVEQAKQDSMKAAQDSLAAIKEKIENSPYKKELDSKHFVAFTYYGGQKLRFNTFMQRIIAYNRTANKANLQVKTILIGKERIIVIRDFENAQQAAGYGNKLAAKTSVFKDIDLELQQRVEISEANYEMLLKEKDLTIYLGFYKEVYP